MFIWDFVADTVLSNIIDWLFAQIVGFLGDFFGQMGNMGVELFELPWVQEIVEFFSRLGWALFGSSVVVCAFECGIEYSSGRGNIRQTAINILKGFMAVSLFTVVPVRLYTLSVSLQATFAQGISGAGASFGTVGQAILDDISSYDLLSEICGVSALRQRRSEHRICERSVPYCHKQRVRFFAPHLLYPSVLDDAVPAERKLGMDMGLTMLAKCDELWAFGPRISKGMEAEIRMGKKLHICARRFRSPCTPASGRSRRRRDRPSAST